MFTSRYFFDLFIFRFLFIVFPVLSSGYLDLDELGSVQYGIDILDKPLLFDETNHPDGIFLSSKYGQKYQCTYESVSTSSQKTKDAEDNAAKVGVVELLKPIESLPCLILTTGWWTYEFCNKKQIKQYHTEEGKIAGDIIFLGHYASEFDWETTGDAKKNSKEMAGRYHSQQYKNGSLCDLTGEMRSTEVRFKCQDGADDHVMGVEEPMTCAYILTVKTDRICHHPALKVLAVKQSVPIVCNPVLNAEDYAEYLEMQQAARKEDDVETPLVGEESSDSVLLEPGTAASLDADSPLDADVISGKDSDIHELVMDSFKSWLAEEDDDKEEDESVSGFQEALKQFVNKKKTSDLKNIAVPESLHDKETNNVNEEEIEESKENENKLSTDSEEEIKTDIKSEDQTQETKETAEVLIDSDGDDPDLEHGSTELGDTYISWQGQGNQIQQITFGTTRKVRIKQVGRSEIDDEDKEIVEEDQASKEFKGMSSSEREAKRNAAKIMPPVRRVEVRVFSASYFDKDGNLLSTTDKQNIERMVIAVLHRNDEEVSEFENHQRLENNYEFQWTSGKKKKLEKEHNLKL